MTDNKLEEIIKKEEEIRKQNIQKGTASFYTDSFPELNSFIYDKLKSPFFKNKNAEIIANNFDRILPLIVLSNLDILLLYSYHFAKQPIFSKKFAEGINKYPYTDELETIINNLKLGLEKYSYDINNIINKDTLEVLAKKDLKEYTYLLNILNEEKQKDFLLLLIENKCNIPYTSINYKGNNKQIIFDNLQLSIKNAKNLYYLMHFVKDNPEAFSQVKDYIDSHEEQALNSIFYRYKNFKYISNPTIKDIIRLIILDVVKNENVKLSDITFNSGAFSKILLIGDKVIKFGDRKTKKFPNNPYIISPLLRKELNVGNDSCFVEVTERVDTDRSIYDEEFYQLYKNIRDLGLVWSDINLDNVGRLKKENIIHWNRNLEPSDETLELKAKVGDVTLKEGDLVILDADYIFEENDPRINFSERKEPLQRYEERYQKEKRKKVTEDYENYEKTLNEEGPKVSR